MKADQHPALIVDYDDLPSLTLVLPGSLGKDQTLHGLVQAIRQVRTDLVARARQFQQRVEECAASGDQLRQALCRGQVLASEHAAAAIDEGIVGVFDIWGQYEREIERARQIDGEDDSDGEHEPSGPAASAPELSDADRVANKQIQIKGRQAL